MSTMLTDAPGSYADPSGMVVQPGASVVPQQLQMPRNPALPQHPLGAYTDAQYEAAVAELRAQTQQQYNDVLRQLGYTDGNGNFVMGSAETDANRQRSDAQYQEDRARENVTHEMQQNGTLFSGYRGTREGQSTMPYEQTKAQLGIDLPNMLSQLHEKANGIVQDFILQHNKLLADAAQRATQAAINAPGGLGGGTDPNAGGTDPNAGGTTPSTDPTLIPPPSGGLGGLMTNTTPAIHVPVVNGPLHPPPLNPANYAGGTPDATGVQGPQQNQLVTTGSAHVPTTPTPAPPPAVPSYDPAAVAAAANARRPGLQQ